MGNEILNAWRRTVRRRGGEVALTDAASSGRTTFAELAQRAEAWAGVHGRGGRLRGRTVVFSANNGAGWFDLFLGIMLAEGIAVLLDPGEPVAAQRALAGKLGAAFWWDGEELVGLKTAKRFRAVGACAIKLTSGSTGEPRPLWFTPAQLLADGRQVMTTMRIAPADVNYALIPFGHSYGLGNLALPLIARGLSVVVGSSALPHAIAADFARWRPTVFPGVPAMWRALAESGIDPAALRSLRLGISAGAPLPAECARAFAERYGQRLHAFYGSSETGGIAYDRKPVATLQGGVGRAMRGVELKLRAGGRLQVCSDAVTTQGNPRRHRGRGCWVMPDRVKLDRGGGVTLLGRRDEVVKIAGRRISLAEVAAAVRALAGVNEVWIGVSEGPDPVLGAAVASQRTATELRAEMTGGVAPWKIPRRWVVLRELPLTVRGKTDVPAIRAKVFSSSPQPR